MPAMWLIASCAWKGHLRRALGQALPELPDKPAKPAYLRLQTITVTRVGIAGEVITLSEDREFINDEDGSVLDNWVATAANPATKTVRTTIELSLIPGADEPGSIIVRPQDTAAFESLSDHAALFRQHVAVRL